MTQKISYSGLKIALYQPDIPQNTAAIVRTCSCLGVQLEIIEPCGFFISDPRFKRVAMDYTKISKILRYRDFESFCLLLYRICLNSDRHISLGVRPNSE